MKPARRYPAKAGWYVRADGSRVYLRSKAEHAHAAMLDMQQRAGHVVEWHYEPRAYEFRERHGTTRYTPDFAVTYADGRFELHEVKGYLDPVSKTKLRRMARDYPEVTLRVFGAAWPPIEKPRKQARPKNRHG